MMNYKLKYSRLIERYLHGAMDTEEKSQFEEQLRTDQELAKEYKLEKELDKALKEEDVILFRSKVIKTIEKHQPKVEEKSSRKIPVASLAAAVITLLIMIGGSLYFVSSSGTSAPRLYEQYYAPDEVAFPRTADYSSQIIEGYIKYQNKNYEQAANMFGRALEHGKAGMSVHFYYAISNMETGNVEKAITSLKYILKDNNNLYTEHAEWYLGLCYLKNGETGKAKEQFEDIVENGNKFHKHKKQAKEILKKLNK